MQRRILQRVRLGVNDKKTQTYREHKNRSHFSFSGQNNWRKNSSPSLLMWSNVIRDNFFSCNCTIFSWMKNFLILGIIFFLLFNHSTPPSKGEKRSDFCPSRPSLFEEDIERLGQIYMKFLRWRLFQNNGVFQQEFFLFWLFYRHLPTSMAGILLTLNYLTLWKKSKIIFMVF